MKEHSYRSLVRRLLASSNTLKGTFLLLSQTAISFTAWAQTANFVVTHNEDNRIILYKNGVTADATATFTLAPEDPKSTDGETRPHWPVIFIDYVNEAGKSVKQMYNLTHERTFTVNVSNTNGEIKITGENGIWKLVSVEQNLRAANIGNALALRYVDFSDNVFGRSNSTYYFDYRLKDLEYFSLRHNLLRGFSRAYDGAAMLKELDLSENFFEVGRNLFFKENMPLSRLDLSKNLLTSAPTLTLPEIDGTRQWTNTWRRFQGGDFAAYQTALTSASSDGLYVDKTEQDAQYNLSVNKMHFGTLPEKPAGLPETGFIYTLQERYALPKQIFALKEAINLQPLKRRINETGDPTTVYKLFKEINAETDEYEEVPADYYSINDGVLTMNRGVGRDVNLFVAMTNPAFATDRPLESFERLPQTTLNQRDYTSGYSGVTLQPQGTEAPYADRRAYMTALSTNNLGDGTTREIATRFYRTNTFMVRTSAKNYWYGFVSNDWANPENWTGGFVPPTTETEFDDLPTNERNNANIEFATVANYQSSAVRDLHTDQNRKINRYFNRSENGRSLVVMPSHRLTYFAGNWPDTDAAKAYENDPNSLVANRLILKAGGGQGTAAQANASFYSVNLRDSRAVSATVEMYSAAHDGNRNKQQATWSYFAAPVHDAVKNQVFDKNAWVRVYDRNKNNDLDEKWNDVAIDGTNLDNRLAYEVTQPASTTYRFKGRLYLGDYSWSIGGNATPTNYNNINILPNPYVAAMKIDRLTFDNPANVDRTIYLFNTGSRQDWKNNDGINTPAELPGTYTAAVPQNLAGYVAGMPTEIPSLSTFVVKATGNTTARFRYNDLEQNTSANRMPRRRLPSIQMELTSDKSYDRLTLVKAEGTTRGYDNGYDAEKVFTAGSAQLYAEGDRDYQVLTSAEFEETQLGFVPADDAGQYQFKFHLDEVDATEELYLVDKLKKEHTRITDGETYTFTATTADAPKRFAIVKKLTTINDATDVAASIEMFANAQRQITVRNHTEDMASLEVFDVAGKLLERVEVSAKEAKTIQLRVPGVVVARAKTATTEKTQRFLLK